ncbi:hypothetical protein SCLCIDRAFT_21046 [Scleroderma citrinum Foug A]|uniref:CCHC-type domain-containing protein n=1 Tax=Scleroderma citrinum Foug A TaxID=1036808 RepID=A0A0C3E3X1_9AGAM|nr:hypothetical protein SCLCIDRAFT_21046 [Scleroderma citrinum Foug A]
MANWDDIILQLANGQQALHNTLQQYIAMQGGAGPTCPKKIDLVPELYNRSPQKFHKWWSKTKAVAVFLHLEGPHAGHYAQVHLDECMVTNTWPAWADLQTEIENFFLLGNNQEWARPQLLCLQQGPHQRIDDFLAQFQALKVQLACLNKYTKDLLERAVQWKVLEQVYMRGLPREMWEQVVAAVCMYFGTNNYASSSTPSGSGAPMDIGAMNTHPQRGKEIQCYNCQGFSHISHECTQPHWAQKQGPQQGWAVQPQADPNNDDERVKAV